MSEHSYSFRKTLTPSAVEFIEATLRRSYDVLYLELGDKDLNVTFSETVGEEEFNALMQQMQYISRSLNQRVLFELHPARPVPADPMQALTARGQVRRVASGMFLLQGEFLAFFRAFNRYWLEMALKMGAVEQEYPVLWPIDLYRKINYFAEFPQQVIMASPVRGEHQHLATIAEKYDGTKQYDTLRMNEHMADSRFGLQCAVCDICYYALEGSRDYQNTLYTTYNKVFRNECSPTGALDRLLNFSVRDIMFVGNESFVLEQRQKMIDLAIDFLQKLDLDCRIATANDPFFANDAVLKSVVQNACELKYELLAKLPFNGSELAIGSINLHQDFFGNAFDIRLPDGTRAWSGCLGIGLERLVYAIYAQYGAERDAWPEHLVNWILP